MPVVVCRKTASALKRVSGEIGKATGVSLFSGWWCSGWDWCKLGQNGAGQSARGLLGSIQYHAGSKVSSFLEKISVTLVPGVLCRRLTGFIDYFQDLCVIKF